MLVVDISELWSEVEEALEAEDRTLALAWLLMRISFQTINGRTHAVEFMNVSSGVFISPK